MNEGNKNQLRIIFFGTPEFAVASLQALVTAQWKVVAVVTAPDKPAGRGLKIQTTAVKQYAEAAEIPVLQPEKLKDPEFLERLKAYQADLQVVVAFRMLPEVVWNMPPKGTINVHASLLPAYRGAAPINRVLMNGETETGVTTFQLRHAIDTGNILLQKKVAITPDMNAGELHDILKEEGAGLLLETVEKIADGSITAYPQVQTEGNASKQAPKIFSEDCKIDWSKTVTEIYNHIRGLSPYPAAYTFLNDKQLKIFSATIEEEYVSEPPGAVITNHKNVLKFAAADGYIHCKEVQLTGKKKMNIEDFLRGYRGG